MDSVAISGGLRGIDGLFVPFRYPIVALCGNNGVGKSTVLALAALAYHSPIDWYVQRGPFRPQAKSGDRSYYTFGDFFLRGAGDQSVDGVSITWTYRDAHPWDPVTFTKSATRWGRYSARPDREVAFIPTGRVLPAHEVAGVRSVFFKQPSGINVSALPETAVQQFSFIMGREYQLAEIQESKRYTFERALSGVEYTAFNMGAGESIVINLLHILHSLPRAGLLVIEEIESGLHPQAQMRLAQVLVQICVDRHAQVICSTHSEVFLDALPRQARLLLTRVGEDHEVYESPSTRVAVYEMTGETQPELTIYCEDLTAKILIEEALPHDLRVRSTVREIGSNRTVIRQGVSHLKSGFQMGVLCALDGDCAEQDVEGWVGIESSGHDEYRPSHVILPGEIPPERWVAEQLRIDFYQAAFAEQFGCSTVQARSFIEAIHAELDHHDIGHCLHLLTNLEPADCVRRTMRAVAPRHPQLDDLRNRVETALG